MASSESGGEHADRADLESLIDNASAERALEDLHAATATDEGRPQPPIDLTAAAFFDVDNTLVQGSSAVHFGRGLAARNYFTYRDVLGFVYAQAKFQLL
ncbi:MAG: HAD-IB family hydrolase, partial [Mycobacterium sp.]|nr:HAD-IB family hydrolase [Mycobacterium sp.]